MKKALSLWFMCLFVLLSFAGCTADSQLPEDTEPSVENTAEPTHEPETTPAAPLPTEDEYYGEGFELDGKKYVYQEDDVLILHVKNLTDVDYDIQVVVDFYDENNVEIDHQEKYFKGFGANWENYFIFRPEVPFARIRCSIEKMESTDTAYSSYLSQATGEDALYFSVGNGIGWHSPEGNRERFDDRRMIANAYYRVLNRSDRWLYFTPVTVLFDKNGEIFVINTGMSNKVLPPENEVPEGSDSVINCYVYCSEAPLPYDDVTGVVLEYRWNEDFREKYNKEFIELLPEELRGDLSFIVSFLAVDDEPIR